jgi:hypothetical protein
MNSTVTMKSPILFPPKDPKLRRRLEAKLAEYQSRKNGKGGPWEYWHPEQAHMVSSAYRDACYKVDVLSAVLSAPEGHPISTFDLSLELVKRYKGAFDVEKFKNACGVVSNYLGQTSYEQNGGTGLPE